MSNKHDANVRKSALVNFQIGLIASLLFSYAMFEVYTSEPTVSVISCPAPPEEVFTVWNGAFKEYVEPRQQAIAEVRVVPVPSPEIFEIVPDPTEIVRLGKEFFNAPPVVSMTFDPNTLETVDLVDEAEIKVPFSVVENVPVFPGCEELKTNKEKAACFNEKIRGIISRKFNTDIGDRYGLTGKQKIYTLFDVSSDGTIQNVQVRAPHPKLKEEAERVLTLFPKMTPGMQREKPVTVKYMLPIIFKVNN